MLALNAPVIPGPAGTNLTTLLDIIIIKFCVKLAYSAGALGSSDKRVEPELRSAVFSATAPLSPEGTELGKPPGAKPVPATGVVT